MKHHKYHYHPQVKAAKPRVEAALDIVLAIAIGVALAACLFYELSA